MTGRGEIRDDSRECVLTELCGCWAPNAGVPPPPKGCDIGRGRGRWSGGTGWVGPGLTRVGLEGFITQSERGGRFLKWRAPQRRRGGDSPTRLLRHRTSRSLLRHSDNKARFDDATPLPPERRALCLATTGGESCSLRVSRLPAVIDRCTLCSILMALFRLVCGSSQDSRCINRNCDFSECPNS